MSRPQCLGRAFKIRAIDVFPRRDSLTEIAMCRGAFAGIPQRGIAFYLGHPVSHALAPNLIEKQNRVLMSIMTTDAYICRYIWYILRRYFTQDSTASKTKPRTAQLLASNGLNLATRYLNGDLASLLPLTSIFRNVRPCRHPNRPIIIRDHPLDRHVRILHRRQPGPRRIGIAPMRKRNHLGIDACVLRGRREKLAVESEFGHFRGVVGRGGGEPGDGVAVEVGSGIDR